MLVGNIQFWKSNGNKPLAPQSDVLPTLGAYRNPKDFVCGQPQSDVSIADDPRYNDD